MEGGVPEIENLVFTNHSAEEEHKQDTKERDDEVIAEEKNTGGAINNFISAFVSGGKEEDKEDEKKMNGNKVMMPETKEGEKAGRIFNHLVSMVTPSAREAEDVERIEDKDLKSEDGVGGNGGGGILHNFISNILHQNEEETRNGKVKATMEVEEDNDKQEEGEEGGGGVVGNLVSNLPIPLPAADNAAPETEEASILIHSIVHD